VRLQITPESIIRPSDRYVTEARDGLTLVVAPATGGWVLTGNLGEIALLDWLSASGVVTVKQASACYERDSRQQDAVDVIKKLLQRGLISLDDTVVGTSSSRMDGVTIIAPRTDHNTYPVLAIFHMHNWCNLACTYCYTIEDGVSKKRLPLEYMERVVDEMRDLPTRSSTFEFHGGEPTMAMSDIQKITEYASRQYAQVDKKIAFSIQTNGYNLRENICDFLAEHNFVVRVSLDGTSDTHDDFRLDQRGKGSHSGVVKGIRRLQMRGVPVHAVCVVHEGNRQRMVEMYDAMNKLNVASIRFLPVFKTGKAGNESWLTGDKYFDSYFEVVRHIAALGRQGKTVTPLPNLLAGEIGSLRSFRREYMCMRNPCGAGINMVTIDVNGDIYPCEEMVGKPEFLVGNIAKVGIREIAETSPIVEALRQRHVDEIEECSTCTWKQMCHGGCVHKSYTHFKRMDRESEHCFYYKKIYKELIWLEAEQPGSWAAIEGQSALKPSP